MEPEAGVGRHLDDRQRLAWLRLIRTENVGPSSFRALINRFGSAEAALAELPELARKGGARYIKISSQEDAEMEMEAVSRMGACFIALGEREYPPLLAAANYPPPLIAAKGNLELLRQPMVAMVGARNASLAGIKMAERLAREIGGQNYVIASGLARGIDAAAHHGSLETGTVGVLAGGLGKPYPPENRPLFQQISDTGVVLSEMPFGWAPRARDFPRRNRIVAGLSYGLLVVEAADRSGSLISARLANEMGRLVFAIPGSPLDPRAAGTNKLLKQGAILVTNADDVLEALSPIVGKPFTTDGIEEDTAELSDAPAPDDDERARVLEALGPTPVLVDEIIRHTGMHPARAHLIVLELDLAGRIERHSGGAVSLLTS
ncbi:DNA-processing protein DprA [Chelativorans sp. Marseille-P2723]|uniref:DNA-processing protein DprA n=1 Tax=Chelativorans sp. Marseille-P2723 TaxID=2709133 RepID=UPI00156F9F1B|nr:DNA-processing protein DprA [Chelativorans sp. Marseille-P2723]